MAAGILRNIRNPTRRKNTEERGKRKKKEEAAWLAVCGLWVSPRRRNGKSAAAGVR